MDGAHIYFGENGLGHVGRVRLDGSSYEPSWVEAPGDPCSVAVDSSYVYWADATGNKIGRTDLTGDVVEPSFIDPGARVACGVAVTGSYVYFGINGGLEGPSRIARANIDGSGLNPSLFSLATYGGPFYQLAVDSLSAPLSPLLPESVSHTFRYRGLSHNRKRGIAKLKIAVPNPGTVVLFGSRVKKVVRRVGKARTVTLTVRPKRKLAKRLRRNGRVRTAYGLRFNPTGGAPLTRHWHLVLLRQG